jgi:hypothetical protein
MSAAARNRSLKTVIAKAFAPHKVTVRGSRGTAYGWVRVHIAYAPRNKRETQELRAIVWNVIRDNNITIDTYGYDDPGSDYGHGSKIHIDFDACREQADMWGDQAWKHNLSIADWDHLQTDGA